MMLTRVALAVRDQEAALEFYTKTLGFEKRADDARPGEARWLTVGPRGQAVEMVLWQAGAAPHLPLPPSHRQPGRGTRMVLEVPDCRRAFAGLQARGVRFRDPMDGRPISQPREEPWGFGADFTDPDGNPFTPHAARKAAAPPADRSKAAGRA